jgi:hypothetical protein
MGDLAQGLAGEPFGWRGKAFGANEIFDTGSAEETEVAGDLAAAARGRREVHEGIKTLLSEPGEELEHFSFLPELPHGSVADRVKFEVVKEASVFEEIGAKDIRFSGMAVTQESELGIGEVFFDGPKSREGGDGVAKLADAED